MTDSRHWNDVYETREATRVSWFEAHAETSLRLIRQVRPSCDARVIDVGGGASELVDSLLTAGFASVAVLDLAGSALHVAQRRLGERASAVTWIEADVCTWPCESASVDVWHDRAVFHFLTEAAQRQAYVRQAARAVVPGGHVIVSTFAREGPEQCSGLPVCRYEATGLAAEFGAAFDLVQVGNFVHRTPNGRDQPFVWCVLRRRADGVS